LLQELVEMVRLKGGTIEPIQADITVARDRGRMVAAAQEYFGGLDILINNAGIGATGHFAEVGPERLRKIMEVNFFGVTETTRAFLPMLNRGHRPAIVNISSIAGKRGIPARSEYSASKFALQGFSEALRAELAKDGIDVLVICPGLTQTNFSRNMLEQKARMPIDHMRGMSPEKVALASLRAIEHGRHEVCLTLQGKLLVFVSRFFPRLADRIAARKVRSLFRHEIQALPQFSKELATHPPESLVGSVVKPG
jgi:short-subunit dehydrogenase